MAKKEIESPSTSLDYLHWWEDNSQPQQPHTFGNILSAIKSGIGNSYDMVDIDRKLNNLWDEYNLDPNVTPERKAEIEREFVDEYVKAKDLAKQQQDTVDWLQKSDSKIAQIGSHAFSAGTSLNSMAKQYGLQGAGAAVGGVLGGALATPETGGLGTYAGAKAGAKLGWDLMALPASGIANYSDADDAAHAVRERVMLATGDANLAQQAYEEARLPNMVAVAPSVLVDALTSKYLGGAIGNLAGKSARVGRAANRMADMMQAARGTRLARGLQRVADTPIGTAIGRAANTIDNFDLPSKAGAWVAGKTNPLAGKVTRGGLALLGELGSEEFQEGEQGVSEDIAFENAMHKFDPTNNAKPEGWTANRIGNWMNSDEGRLTMLDTAVSTLLTGSATTALGGFAKLPQGYNNKYNLRNVDSLMVEMGQGGILQNISPEKLGEIKHVAGVLQGMQTDEEISAQSPEQAIRVWLEDASERAQKQKGLNEEEASAYAINNLINNATEFSGRPDYLSEASQAYFDKYKIRKAEGLIDMETRQREEQKAKEQTAATAKETHEGTIPSEVAPQSYIDGRKSGIIDKDGNPIQEQDTQQQSNTLQSKISNILPDGQAWSVDNTTATGEQYAEGTVLVKNNKTNKLVRVDRAPDGKSLFVTDITPVETLDENNKPVQVGDGRGRNSRRVDGRVMKFTTDEDGFKNLGKFFLDNQNETKTLKQERDEQSQQAAPPDPNRRRVMVNGVHDLANFYRQNSDLMDRDTFMLTVNNMMAYGNGNISLDLDLENDNNGIVGEVNPDEIDQMLRDGTSKAIIHLYQGADAITVLHEFAHVGYKTMSAHEQQLFNRMAEMSEASFVADMLKQVYPQYSEIGEDEIIGLVRQAAESGDGRVWRDISNIGVLRQTIDILNGGADEEQHQRACEERYAWEFTMWYIEGYTKGKQPTNRMQQMLNRTCGTLGKALELIGTVAERLQSDGWQAISNKSMVSMFENMNTRQFNTGNPNTQRMYGGYMTGEQQEQFQRERELAQQQEQQRAAQQAAMEQAIVEQYNGSPQQQNLSGETQQTPTTVSGEQQKAITTQRNKQRREQDTQKLQAQKEPVVLRELQKLVDGNENFTDNEAAMVQKLSHKGFAWYANRVLSRRYPNEGRMAIISSLDKDGKYKDTIEGKRYTALKRGNTFESRRNVRQSMKNTGDSVIGSLRTEAEQGVQMILRELLERNEQGQKQLQGYINGNKKNFETQKIYKEAMRRFKSMQTREATKYDKIASETLRNAAWNSTGEIDRTEDGDSVYGTVNPPSVLDSLRKDAEEIEKEKQRKYIEENEDKVQDKYKKLMDKYEKGGLEAVGKTMNSPAIKKDPTFWNEAYNRLLKDVQQKEEQKKAEEQQKQAEKEKAFENDVQKVVGLLNEKQKKSENSLKMFLVRNSKKFKEDPIYVEAKKRFDEGRQSGQETTQEQVQEKQQPEVRNEVQQQEQVQPASQTVQTEKAQPVVESKEEETTKQVEEPKAKEETTNGKTEDSGRVEDIRGTEGEVQTGRDNGVSTNQRPDVRQHGRNSVETTGAGNGESVSLLKDKKGKLIGRKIEKVNNGRESKDTKRVIEAAYDGEMPLPIDGFVDITGSKNADGDKGIDIFNKLFGTNYDSGNAVVHQSGKSGYVIDDDGNCIISIAKKQKGVLTNTALIAKLDERVNYVYASEIESATISAYKSVGFEPIARIYKDRDTGEVIVFEKTKQTPDELINGFKSKGRKRVKVDSLPTFNSREEFERRNEIVEKTTKQNPISEETRNNINEKIGDAVSMFPTTSDKELEEVISKVDEKLKNDKSTSKMKSETRYRLETLRSAAQEELENRKKDVEFDEDYEEPVVANREILEGGVLNTVSDAENLYVERYENKANKVKDTTTAKQILEESGVEEKEEQDEQVQEEVEEEVEEEAEEEEEDTEDTIEGEPSSLDQFFEYFGEMADQLDEGVEDSPANALLDKIKSDTEKLSSDQTEEDKGKIKDRIMKNMKKFNEMINNYQERVAQEELDDAKENSYTSDKEVTPQLPQKLAKEVNLTKFDPDNSHRIVISDLTTNGKKHKGIAEKDAVSITEVQDFVRYLHKKYDTAGTNINLNYVEMDEEDKKKLGSIYRKLSRQKNLVQERLKSGVYGTKYTKTNPNSIYSHARAYLTEISSSNRDKGGLNLIGVLKQIMNTNLVYEYKYGFDEIDQKKKVTDAQLDKARKNITNLRGKIEALQEQRRNASTKQERRTCTRKINELVNELKEQQILLWSHGTDFRGNGKYQDEAADWSLGRWKAYQRKLERQLNRSGEFKEIKKWRRNNKLKRANEERIAKSTPTLDKEVSINEGQLQDEDNWNNFFNGFKKNIEPLYKNAKKTLNGIEDVLKFRTLKEIVKLHKNGKDVEGMLNNVTKVVDEAQNNGHLSEEEASKYKGAIKDLKKAFFKETGQEEKISEMDKEPAKKQRTEKKVIELTQEEGERIKQIENEFSEVMKPFQDFGVKYESGQPITKQDYERAIKVANPLNTLIKKYSDPKNIPQNMSDNEKQVRQNLMNEMQTAKKRVQEVKSHYTQFKKGNFTPVFKSLETITPQQITTTKSNKSKSETTQKPTQQKNTKQETNKSTKSEQKGKTLTADKFKEITDGMFSMLDKNEKALRNTTVQKLAEFLEKGGYTLTPRQRKSIENKLGMRQERLQQKDNKTETATEQNKPNKSKKNLHQETDTQLAKQARDGYEALTKAFPNTRFQWVYHGTIHDFDEFSLAYIGSGQGGAWDGYGLYFANKASRAAKYFNMTKKQPVYKTEDGKEYTTKVMRVDIPEDKFLLKNQPFSEQSKQVQDALVKIYAKLDNVSEQQARDMLQNNSIAEPYWDIANKCGKSKDKTLVGKTETEKASRLLNKYGVKGQKVILGSLAKAGLEPATNIDYVIFDDKCIKILSKIYQNGNSVWSEEHNTSKANKSRHMETDVIPDTSVEENRDINSITFTKSALKESKVNRDRAKTLHDNNKYWKETKNPDGSITYTRQKRQPWHTKAVTYSGINGKEVSKEPLGKISEGFQRVWNWYKEKWLNEQTAIKDLAESVGAPEAWMDFVVQKDMGSLGMTAIERGIVKHNSKTKERTTALMDFAKEFKDEQEQLDWLDYCEAQRIVHDLHPKGIEQKMTFETANKIINKVKNSSNAKRFEEWRQKFVEYNKELLHVLVDGNIITEDLYQKLIKEHPNFIPLSKDMSDFDEAMSFMSSHKDLLNVKSPLHRIGSSLREVKNPLLEMQKRTMDYYQRAAQNKAALTFIDKIVTKITKLANGDEVMLNQAILHKLAPQYTKKGTIKDISDPNKGIFYVMRNGKKEFYQLSDASVYKALRSLSPEHMGGFEKFVNFLLSKPAQIVRTLATITFDFAIGNLYRDAGEAFMTSRHGYFPLYDSFWGMWQMYNDTEWFKEYNSQVGDMTSRIKENGRIAGIEDNVENQLFRIPVIGHIARAMSTFNEYMEQGTRIGEYKNARMGYEGTLGRLRGESANLAKAKNSKEYAAFRAKDITLNFLQHGAWGKKFNRVTPFFNAALQGQYKIINTIDEMIHNKEGMRNEMLLKAALIAYLSFMTGWNGAGDDDYEEAPDWERDNYTIRGDGSRTPKDQVLGKLIGNPFEQLGYYAKKGKFKNDAIDTLVDELKALALPDNLTPAFINLWIGLSGGHDTFKGKQIVPEYMKDDLGYLQKDLSTSNFATDLSKFAYDTFGIDVSAKKLDWSINQFLSNTGKYWNKIWDTARTEVTGEKNERTGHMYMEEDSKGAADYLNYSTGNNIIDGTLDLARMAFGKKFIQNQTTFDSLQDFNEEYLRLKKLSSDPQRITKEETKAYETIYKPAYDKIKKNRSKLSEIGKNSSLDKNQKLVKSRPIILDSIRTARDAEKAANKLLKK